MKNLAVIKQNNENYVIRIPGTKDEVFGIFPEIVNFVDLKNLFNDEGDWFCRLIINEVNGFNSTLEIADYLSKNGVEVDYSPELGKENGVVGLDLQITENEENGKNNDVILEFLSPDDFYNKSYYIRIKVESGKDIMGEIKKVFEKIYKNKNVKTKFELIEVSIGSSNLFALSNMKEIFKQSVNELFKTLR